MPILKIAELSGKTLDCAVAKIHGWEFKTEHTTWFGNRPWYEQQKLDQFRRRLPWELTFSTNWELAGPIVDSIDGLLTKTWLESKKDSKVEVHIHNYDGNWAAFGPDLLTTIMRCYAISKLGTTFDVPIELISE